MEKKMMFDPLFNRLKNRKRSIISRQENRVLQVQEERLQLTQLQTQLQKDAKAVTLPHLNGCRSPVLYKQERFPAKPEVDLKSLLAKQQRLQKQKEKQLQETAALIQVDGGYQFDRAGIEALIRQVDAELQNGEAAK